MRANRTLEIGTGIFVLLGFAALFFLTTQLPTNGLKVGGAQGGFQVTAEFDNIGDLKSGAPVALSGVTIGEVTGIGIDPQNYHAVVTMRIDPNYNQIPDDSDASINTQGLLGGQYIALDPGGSETFLKNGSQIPIGQTQSAFVLENLINKLFASFASKPAESGQGGSSAPASSSPGGTSTGPAGGGKPEGGKHDTGKPH